ncbi:MAG: SlyX family protein [Candidatus Rariloculaceae bacterium]
MTESKHLRKQLVDLESHLAHLELTIQNLSDNASKQWDRIEHLEQTVKGLQQHCLSLKEIDYSTAVPEEPPPHY